MNKSKIITQGNSSHKNLHPTTKKLGIFAGLALLVFLGWSFYSAMNPAPPEISSPANEVSGEILKIKNDDHIQGNPDGKVVLVEYLDFECEACAAYFPLVKQLKGEFGDDLTIVTRYFPLPGHKNSMTSAVTVEAASRQGKFLEMQNKLFGEQKQWGEKADPSMTIFLTYAQQLGLNMEQFEKDVKDPAVKERIMRDVESGKALKINATPSFFLNGAKLSNIRSYEDLSNLVRSELSKSSKQ